MLAKTVREACPHETFPKLAMIRHGEMQKLMDDDVVAKLAVRAAGIPIGSHLRAATFLRHVRDAPVVGGDDDFAEGFGRPAPLDDILEERLTAMRCSGRTGKRVEPWRAGMMPGTSTI